jgi:molybdenum cofactor cytidylyltransferase
MPDRDPLSPDQYTSAAIILAAGAATRMGSIKQLLPYGDGTLLSHAVAQAANAGFQRVIVVLGAQAQTVAVSLHETGAETVINPGWQTGMGSSLLAGLKKAEEGGAPPDFLAILLADQPYVVASHLVEMLRFLAASSKPIIAAQYNNRLGVPAIFRKSVLPQLRTLSPETGARQLLRNAPNDVLAFPLPEAATDIDTPADFFELGMVRP